MKIAIVDDNEDDRKRLQEEITKKYKIFWISQINRKNIIIRPNQAAPGQGRHGYYPKQWPW